MVTAVSCFQLRNCEEQYRCHESCLNCIYQAGSAIKLHRMINGRNIKALLSTNILLVKRQILIRKLCKVFMYDAYMIKKLKLKRTKQNTAPQFAVS